MFALLVFAPMGGWVGKIWRGGGSCTQTEKRACCINSTWLCCVARHNHAFHCGLRFTVVDLYQLYCMSQITHSTICASFVSAQHWPVCRCWSAMEVPARGISTCTLWEETVLTGGAEGNKGMEGTGGVGGGLGGGMEFCSSLHDRHGKGHRRYTHDTHGTHTRQTRKRARNEKGGWCDDNHKGNDSGSDGDDAGDEHVGEENDAEEIAPLPSSSSPPPPVVTTIIIHSTCCHV